LSIDIFYPPKQVEEPRALAPGVPLIGSLRVISSGKLFFTAGIQGLKINSMGAVLLSIFIPTEDEQRAQRYSYSSPSGRTKSNFFRTGTAVLHLGQ
jgi:hypothetical protein